MGLRSIGEWFWWWHLGLGPEWGRSLLRVCLRRERLELELVGVCSTRWRRLRSVRKRELDCLALGEGLGRPQMLSGLVSGELEEALELRQQLLKLQGGLGRHP